MLLNKQHPCLRPVGHAGRPDVGQTAKPRPKAEKLPIRAGKFVGCRTPTAPQVPASRLAGLTPDRRPAASAAPPQPQPRQTGSMTAGFQKMEACALGGLPPLSARPSHFRRTTALPGERDRRRKPEGLPRSPTSLVFACAEERRAPRVAGARVPAPWVKRLCAGGPRTGGGGEAVPQTHPISRRCIHSAAPK